jgi:predicted DNA-binding transcriptional regulator AlpA
MVEKRISPPQAVAWTSASLIEWQRRCVEQSGRDPATVPNEPFRFVRLPEVLSRTGLSRSTVYRRIQEGSFPAPLVIGVQELAA